MKIILFVLLLGVTVQHCSSALLPLIRPILTPPQIPSTNQRCACSNCLLKNLLCGVVRILPVTGKLLPNVCCDCAPKPECPQFKCQALQCPNGQRPTFMANGCRKCDECIPEIKRITTPEPESITTALEPDYVTTSEPECITTPEPVCPQLDCAELNCLYGKKSTVLANGCTGCDECLPELPCKKMFCVEPKCAYGAVATTLSNGCPGCKICRVCEALTCDECVGTAIKTFLPDGCPGCDVCVPEPGSTTQEPEITTTVECVTTQEPESTTTEEPECVTTQEPESTTTEEPECTTTSEPECTTTEEPECVTTQEQESTTTEEPECRTTLELEPQCPLLDCEELDCAYGTKSTVLPNGCPGCDECLPKPECKKMLCIKPKCPNGLVSTILSNGCKGCDVCAPVSPVTE